MRLEMCEPDSKEISAGDQAGATLLQSVNLMSRVMLDPQCGLSHPANAVPRLLLLLQVSQSALWEPYLCICFPSMRHSCKPACAHCHC